MSTELGFKQGQEAEYRRWLKAFEKNGHKTHPGLSPENNLAEALREERRKVREECAKIAEAEKVDAEDTQHAADIAYNDACKDISKRIRES